MTWWLLLKGFLGTMAHAVGQVFAWLNRREDRAEKQADEQRLSELLSAAATPSRAHADRLNRWLSRGRSGRLRRRP